jgi:hypothetical protein
MEFSDGKLKQKGFFTVQGHELHLALYGKQEQVLLLEVPTTQRPELDM